MSSLPELPHIGYEDPLASIDWNAVDRECWWLPPSLVSLAGVRQFEALPLRERQVLSQLEYAHLLQAGLWLESQFMARLARLAHQSDDVVRRARFLHEVREEAGHSLMFVELLHRSGYGVQRERGFALRAVDVLGRMVPSRTALFWAMVVAGEEIPNRLNMRMRRGVEEVTLSAVVYRIAKIHVRDEALHAAYAREQCRREAGRCGAGYRAMLSPLLSLAIDMYAHYVCYPPLLTYQRAGLTPARLWRARAIANPARKAQIADILRPTVDFLRRSGWRVSSRYC